MNEAAEIAALQSAHSDLYAEVGRHLGRIRELELRMGELIDAILTHRRDTPPGASGSDHKLWSMVVTHSEETDDG